MRRFKKSILSLALIAVASISCERQMIYDPEYLTANIPIVIDWSESMVDEDYINNVSVYFYPEDGSEPVVIYSEDPYFVTANLHEGKYDIVIHNEIEGNILGVDCASSESFSDYKMTIQQDDVSNYDMFYEQTTDEQLIKESEAIGAWSYESFEVTKDMIVYTRTRTFEDLIVSLRSKAQEQSTKSSSDDVIDDMMRSIAEVLDSSDPETRSVTRSLDDLNGVKPQPRTAAYKVLIDIENLNNIQYIEGVIDGFVDGVEVVSGGKIESEAANFTYMQMSDHTFNEGSTTDGTMTYSLTNFGHLNAVGEKYTLTVNIIIHSGEKFSETFDVTDQINSYSANEIIEIRIGYKYDNGTPDIVLPENQDAGFGVDGWGDAENVEL
ncbi:MAG: DUF5119 domain-containing protein [Rikenellaceae bacterium]